MLLKDTADESRFLLFSWLGFSSAHVLFHLLEETLNLGEIFTQISQSEKNKNYSVTTSFLPPFQFESLYVSTLWFQTQVTSKLAQLILEMVFFKYNLRKKLLNSQFHHPLFSHFPFARLLLPHSSLLLCFDCQLLISSYYSVMRARLCLSM